MQEIGTGGYCCLHVLRELQRKTLTCTNIYIHIYKVSGGPISLSLLFSTFVQSGLAAVLDRWDLPVSVFPFNTVLLLYLACTGIENPYFPNHPALPQGPTLSINSTQLDIPQVRTSICSSGETKAFWAYITMFMLRNVVQTWMTHDLGLYHEKNCGVMDSFFTNLPMYSW